MQMAIMCLFGMLFLFVTLFQLVPFEDPQDRNYFLLFLFAWNAFVFYVSYRDLLKPAKIIIKKVSSFVLHSPLKTFSYRPTEVHRLGCDPDGDCYIWCNDKKFDLEFFKQSQLEAFFQKLKAENSLIEN